MDTPLERSNLPPLDKNKPRAPSQNKTELAAPTNAKTTKKDLSRKSKDHSPTLSSAEVTLDIEEPPASRRSPRKKAKQIIQEQLELQEKQESEFFDEEIRAKGEMVFSDDNDEEREARRRREEERLLEEERLRQEEERRKEEERLREEEKRRSQMKSEREIQKQLEEERAYKRYLQEEEELLEYQIQTLREKAIIVEESFEERRQNRASRNSVEGRQSFQTKKQQPDKPTLYTI